jgi:hypothetical protein
MRARDQTNTIWVIECLGDVLTKSVSCTAWRNAPATAVIRIGPQQVAHRTWNERTLGIRNHNSYLHAEPLECVPESECDPTCQLMEKGRRASRKSGRPQVLSVGNSQRDPWSSSTPLNCRTFANIRRKSHRLEWSDGIRDYRAKLLPDRGSGPKKCKLISEITRNETHF